MTIDNFEEFPFSPFNCFPAMKELGAEQILLWSGIGTGAAGVCGGGKEDLDADFEYKGWLKSSIRYRFYNLFFWLLGGMSKNYHTKYIGSSQKNLG
jgi:hypothetical protein